LMSQLSCRQSLKTFNPISNPRKILSSWRENCARLTRLKRTALQLYQQLFHMLQATENSKTAHKFRFKNPCIH
jgi:putative transposase